MAVYRNDLVCDVKSLTYDFSLHEGQLYLAEGHCCDMGGCIAVFKAIDPAVSKIQTYSGIKIDTVYALFGDRWESNLRE